MSNLATFTVAKSDLVSQGGDMYAVRVAHESFLSHRSPNGEYVPTPLPASIERFLSMQPYGFPETREVIGPWEIGQLTGNKLVFLANGTYWTVLVAENR